MTATDKSNQLHGGLKKLKVEEDISNNKHKSQNSILSKRSEGIKK